MVLDDKKAAVSPALRLFCPFTCEYQIIIELTVPKQYKKLYAVLPSVDADGPQHHRLIEKES